MSEIKFSTQAYCKMILHAAKYPHASVNGILLAAKSNTKGGVLRIVDCVPLFHLCLNLSPMAEIALTQIDHVASSQNLVIAGYYHAFENLRDVGNDKPLHRIAEKIAENYNNSCVAIIDNRYMTLAHKEVAIMVSQCVDGKWRPRERGVLEQKHIALDTTAVLLQMQAYDQLVDFDNHLDSPDKDWMNPEINNVIQTCYNSDEDEEDEEDEDED